MKKYKNLMLSVALVLSLNSCAAGSLTAAYAAKANVAEGLTAEAEQKIVDRTKKEIHFEIKAGIIEERNDK